MWNTKGIRAQSTIAPEPHIPEMTVMKLSSTRAVSIASTTSGLFGSSGRRYYCAWTSFSVPLVVVKKPWRPLR